MFSCVLSGDSDQPDQRVPDRVAGGLHGDRLAGLLLRPGRPDAHLRQPAGRTHQVNLQLDKFLQLQNASNANN